MKDFDELDEDQRSHRLLRCAADGDLDGARRLIAAGVQMETKDEAGFTALHLAAKSGKLEMVQLLLRNGSDPQSMSISGTRPVHVAARAGHVEILRTLAGGGASLLALDGSDRTAGHHAALGGWVSVLEELAARGALRHWNDDEAATPLTLALLHRHHDAVSHLARNGGDADDTLMWLCESSQDYIEETRFALDGLGGNPEFEDSLGWRPAYQAAMGGKREVIEMILDHPKTTQDTRNMTLAILLRGTHAELADAALARGADRRIVGVMNRLPSDALLWQLQKLRRCVNSELMVSGIDAAMPPDLDVDETTPTSNGFTL